MKSKCIFETKKKNGTIYYRLSITRNNKHISLGSFDTLDEAEKAYSEALAILNDSKYVCDDYDESLSISFSKYIMLINFRDNGLYISNPIYLRPNFFYYYLDKDTVFKFDRDDLFYYSGHKICKRNNHIFTHEYGMQININERYNIPSYAVYGKDYVFKNDDRYDYRYSNIEIINKYHGVTRISKNNKTYYEVKIHVNGYLKVGEFEDEITAAIAYNKAADILSKKYDKTFITNFPDLNPKDYAQMYSEIQIPKNIQKLL